MDTAARIGRFVAMTLIYAVMLIAIMFIMVQMCRTCGAEDSLPGFTAMFIPQENHVRCKSRGGCSVDCPHISPDDPRVLLNKQVHVIENVIEFVKEGIAYQKDVVCFAISRLSAQSKIDEITGLMPAIDAIKARCANNLSTLYMKAQTLKMQFGSADTITAAVVSANNRVSALTSAAVINKNIYMACVAQSNAIIMNARVANITSTADQSKIDNYDKKMAESTTYTKSIDSDFGKLSGVTADTSDYSTLLAVALNDASTSEAVVNSMALLFNAAEDSQQSVSTILAKFDAVNALFQATARRLDSFSNDLPGTITASESTNLIERNDYNSVLMRTSLEPEIITDHKKFAKERSSLRAAVLFIPFVMMIMMSINGSVCGVAHRIDELTDHLLISVRSR